MADIWLAVWLCLCTAGMAYMGVHLTMHHPESNAAEWRWKIGFIALALVTCGLIAWQTARNISRQEALQKRLDKIQHNTETPPTVQVNLPPIIMPPTTTKAHIDSGNLRDRTSDLSKELFSFLRMRESTLESLYQQQKAGSNRWDVYGPWTISTSGGFKSIYGPRVFAIRNECANFHVVDTELDNELQMIQTIEQSTGNTGALTAASYIPHPDSIKKIAERLAVLSTQIGK